LQLHLLLIPSRNSGSSLLLQVEVGKQSIQADRKQEDHQVLNTAVVVEHVLRLRPHLLLRNLVRHHPHLLPGEEGASLRRTIVVPYAIKCETPPKRGYTSPNMSSG
jgi:hypothetical protein